jgi:hypothetical protein
MRGVETSLNHIATAVVIVPIVVGIRIRAIRVIVSVVVIVTIWEEAESRAVPEVAIAETTTITVVESAATETIIPQAAGHPGTEAAALEAPHRHAPPPLSTWPGQRTRPPITL